MRAKIRMSVVFKINIKKVERLKSEIDRGLFLEGSNGAAVILIHGLTGTPQEMKFLAQFLNQKGYSVSCPRLANHGEPIEILKKNKMAGVLSISEGSMCRSSI